MERQSVTSSNLASVGYEPETETLEIEFIKSGVYQYYNVPAFMYERMMSADSVGKFFNAEIKNVYAESKM
ncbi:KTSC domain-containing protein [Bosea sp. (in: a-proteobacteria)]|uniref:KTSC domain-containing protein n=1 Tax=Bosea sp. (in: a-proteobacteria) TaxID=1871050 RepID=UPI00403369B6